MHSLHYRKATDQDLEYLLWLRIETMEAHLQEAGIILTREEHLQRIHYQFDQAQIILSQEGKRIGLLKQGVEETAIEIIQFQIDPRLQGQGLGRAVVEQVIQEAQLKNQTVTLSVLKANPARQLYQRLGFQITATTEDSYVMEIPRPSSHPMPVIIETDRMLLRRFTDDDYPAIYAFGSHPEVQKYTGEPPLESPEMAKAIIQKIWTHDYLLHGYGRWAAVHKMDNQVIGFAGLKYLPVIQATDIGFRFLPQYWGQGIGTEVAQAIIQYGFEQLALERIIGIAMSDNQASCRVLEKIGLQFYKIDEYEGDGGQHRWYGLSKEVYKKGNER